MSGSEKKTDEFLDRLILDIKALVLLHDTDAELKAGLERRVLGSQDESIKKFVGALQKGAEPGAGRLMAVAIGELLLASLLILAGTVVLVPTVVGISTPAGLVQYFAVAAYGALAASPFASYVGFIEYAVGAIMIVSAFYSLRLAALNLKEMGLSIKAGEA